MPLLLGPRVLGVLFAAKRSERPFGREEVALLGSLAAHAAVAIDNARLLADMQQTLSELGDASRFITEQKVAVERAADAHDRLTDLVLSGGDAQDVAAAVSQVLGGGLLLIDADGLTLARAGEAADADTDRLAEALRMARASGRAVAAGDRWVAPVVAGGEQLGTLVLDGRADLAGADRRIFERAALVTALLLLFQRTVADAEARVRGDLLHDLLTAFERNPEGVRAHARRLGLDLDVEHAVVVVHAPVASGRQRLAFADAQLAKAHGGLAGELAGEVVLLLPGIPAGEAARKCASQLGAALAGPVTAGGAWPAKGEAMLVAAYQQARRCLEVLRDLDRDGTGASLEDLGFLGLVLGERGDPAGFIRSTLGPMLDYDARRRTKLLETLGVYFARGGNLSRAKDDLRVHVNTVTQRLDLDRPAAGVGLAGAGASPGDPGRAAAAPAPPTGRPPLTSSPHLAHRTSETAGQHVVQGRPARVARPVGKGGHAAEPAQKIHPDGGRGHEFLPSFAQPSAPSPRETRRKLCQSLRRSSA